METLAKMAPTKEEELKLRNFTGDISKLGSAERFLRALLDIPFCFKRVDAMLYRANFDGEINYLRKSFQTLEVRWLTSHSAVYYYASFLLAKRIISLSDDPRAFLVAMMRLCMHE